LKVKGLPSIISDETLASWIFRCAYSTHCPTVTTIDLEGLNLKHKEDGTLQGFDFDFLSAPAQKILTDFQSSEVFLRRVFTASRPLLEPDYRFAYCPECLSEDVAAYGLPAWRRSWCYIHAPICFHHKKLLLIFPDSDSVEKSHFAFISEMNCESSSDAGFYERSERLQLSKSTMRDRLALKTQYWLDRAFMISTIKGAKNKDGLLASEILFVCGLLMQYLLRPKSFRHTPGPARYFFSDTKNLKWPGDPDFAFLQKTGVLRSTPYQRMTALLFIGYIFGLYREKELSWLRCFSRSEGFFWFDSVHDVGAIVCPFQTKHHVSLFVRSFRTSELSKEMNAILDPFMRGAVSLAKTNERFYEEWYEL